MDGRLPVSVLLLARDETGGLESLLPALAFAREVVVVWDLHGDPATRAAAERLGARVHERALDGFGPQRRFALAQCREPWVLWLDADERLDERAVAEVRRVTGGRPASEGCPPEADGFALERRTFFLGRRIRFCGWRGETVLRLFRRERASFDDAPVHERVRVEGQLGRLGGAIEHHSYATWEACVRKLSEYARAGAERARRAGRSAGPLDVVARPPLRFLRMYVLQLGVLDGFHGFLVCALAAAQVFLKYAELWSGRWTGPR
jgi:hypothetical protein